CVSFQSGLGRRIGFENDNQVCHCLLRFGSQFGRAKIEIEIIEDKNFGYCRIGYIGKVLRQSIVKGTVSERKICTTVKGDTFRHRLGDRGSHRCRLRHWWCRGGLLLSHGLLYGLATAAKGKPRNKQTK